MLLAEHALVKALDVNPMDAKAYQIRGRLYWSQNLKPEAKAMYLKAASFGTPDGQLASELATVMQQTGQPQLAMEYYRSAISLGAAADMRFVQEYAEALRANKTWDMARQVLAYATSAYPQHPVFPRLMADALMDQNRFDEAAKWLDEAMRRAPGEPSIWPSLARASAARKDPQDAARWLRIFLARYPYDKQALTQFQQLVTSPGAVLTQ
jgi:tetratricopeptide (TPR) repeat protein